MRKQTSKKIWAKVKQVIPESVDFKQIDLWFQDEARLGQRGTKSRLWAEKGSRPAVIRQQQFLSTHVFGALCPATAQAVGLVMPHMNTESMQAHLDEIAKNVPENRHAVIVMDRAPWHTTGKLVIPKNISLLPLPAYSPELNPVEQVWQWLRRRFWSNRSFSGYDDIVAAASNAWKHFASLPETIASIGYRSYCQIA